MTRPEWVEAGARALFAHVKPELPEPIVADELGVLLMRADAAAVITAVESLIRDDERKRWGLGWIATANTVSAMAAAERNAEAVAARLVEVICEQEADADRRVARMILRGIKMRDDALADLRAQIAADLLREAARARNSPTGHHPDLTRWTDSATLKLAARIARGDS